MSYRCAMALLSDMYPVDGGVSTASALRGIGRAAQRARPFDSASREEGNSPISLPFDTTFVRASDTDRYHGLEILVGAVGQGSEPVQYFASPLSMKEACVELGKAAIGRRLDKSRRGFQRQRPLRSRHGPGDWDQGQTDLRLVPFVDAGAECLAGR